MVNPCLSCNNTEINTVEGQDGSVSVVSCHGCGMAFYSTKETLEELIARWNRLSPVSHLNKVNEDIVSMARRYKNMDKKDALLDASSVIVGRINSLKK